MHGAQEIINSIKKRQFKPLYLLSGEEPYFIDQIADAVAQHVLSDAEKDFNQSVLYGRDVSVEEVVATAKRFPMMAEHQVVILKEAQNLGKKIANFASYFKNPQPSTILVICYKYKKIDGRSAFYKAAKKNGIVFNSKKLYDNKIPGFIQKSLKAKGYSITLKAAHLLAEFLGTDLGKINNELGKLEIIVPKDTDITPEIIEKNIGFSKDFNNFELQKALGYGDFKRAFRIVNYFSQNPKENPILGTLPLLYRYFSQLLTYHGLKDKSKGNIASKLGVHPYFVNDYVQGSRTFPMKHCSHAIAVLRDIDSKAKGVGVDNISQGDLLKELLVKIAR